MFDRLQYMISEYIKRRRYENDRPKNKHFKVATTFVIHKADGMEVQTRVFERISYDRFSLYFLDNPNDSTVKYMPFTIKTTEIKKLLDIDGNVIWKKTKEK